MQRKITKLATVLAISLGSSTSAQTTLPEQSQFHQNLQNALSFTNTQIGQAYGDPEGVSPGELRGIRGQLTMMGWPEANPFVPKFGIMISTDETGAFAEMQNFSGRIVWKGGAGDKLTSVVTLDIIPVRVPLPALASIWENYTRTSFQSIGEWKVRTEPTSGGVPGLIMAMKQTGSDTLILTRLAEGPDGVYILDCRLSVKDFSKEEISKWVEALNKAMIMPIDEALKMMATVQSSGG